MTGWTGQLGQRGEPIDQSILEELIGARFVRRLDSLDNWVRLAPSINSSTFAPLLEGIRFNWPFLVKGPAAEYQPTSAIAVGELLKPHRTRRQLQGKEGTDWPMSADSPVGPAILLNPVGKGKVLTFACSPDYATASEHHIVESRRLLVNAIRMLNPNPRVRITAPATVEAVVTENPEEKTLRIHLLGYNSPPQTIPPVNRPFVLPGLIEDAPFYRVTVECADPFRTVSAVNPSTEVRRSGHRIEATIQDIHETLVINY